jgi:N-acetylmuramic acid 6-phosphate etherase
MSVQNKIKLDGIATEQVNVATAHIDELSTVDMLTVINAEDQKVAQAVGSIVSDIAQAVDMITEALSEGGRLIYIGAGTSGRLGILDASECPPTYGTAPEQIVGIIAGGDIAMRQSVEGAEDSGELAVTDLKNLHLSASDVVCGIAASGRTPYVIGGLQYAKEVGAGTIALACSRQSEIGAIADIALEVVPGAEVVTGSTRMKAGTAQKMVLNMLTTGSMIKLGKVFGNLMVDVQPANLKLLERQRRIVSLATGCSADQAENMLNQCDRHCKTAIFVLLSGLDVTTAKAVLAEHQWYIHQALRSVTAKSHV